MKKLLFRVLPALCIAIALIVSALIFERGCKHIAGGLSDISRSTRNATDSIMREVQDFPSYISVGISGSLSTDVDGSLDVFGVYVDVPGSFDVDVSGGLYTF